jgi:hypothetical protein
LTSSSASFPRFGLPARLGIIAAVLAAEILVMSYLIQATPLDSVSGPAAVVRHVQHWLFRFLIAYAVSLAMLVYMRGAAPAAGTVPDVRPDAAVRIRWGIAHALLLIPFAFLSVRLYGAASALKFTALAIAWHQQCAVGDLCAAVR